jgi:hypothetical protein
MKEILTNSNNNNIKHIKINFLEIDDKNYTNKEQEKKLSLRKEKFTQKIFDENIKMKKIKKININIDKEEIKFLKIPENQKIFEIKNLVKFLFLN